MGRVLIACEFSGTVREAFRDLGHDAWSVDLLPSEIDGEGKHMLEAIAHFGPWDLMIGHPPCTYLTVTGNRWFRPEYRERFPTRERDREEAIQFFNQLYCADIPRICIENPVGIMSRWAKPTQIIQPYQFGHPEPKKTCLWLKNLPPLIPTKIVEPEYITFASGKRMGKWYAEAWRLPKEERARVRNKTFQGVANAFANQWSPLLP